MKLSWKTSIGYESGNCTLAVQCGILGGYKSAPVSHKHILSPPPPIFQLSWRLPWLLRLVFLAAELLLQLALLQMFNNGDYLGFFVLFSLSPNPFCGWFSLKFNDGDYLGFFVLFSLPLNPFCSWLFFKCLTTAITLAFLYCFPCHWTPSAAGLALLQMFSNGDYIDFFVFFFLAAKPLLQLALLQMFNDGDYLGFFAFFSLPPNPFCIWLSFKRLRTAITSPFLSCFPCHWTPSAAYSPSNV